MSTIKVDTVRPVTTDADLALQGDASGAGVTGAKVFGDGSLGADSITDLAGDGAPDFPNGQTVSSGAESTPSITNTGDTDTGIYFPAANTVGVSTGGTERMRIGSSGNITAGSGGSSSDNFIFNYAGGAVRSSADGGVNFGLAGNRWANIFATNGTIQTSDERLKKNIAPLPSMLDKVLQLKPSTWEAKYDSYFVGSSGFIAQELEQVFPDLVQSQPETVEGHENIKTISVSGAEMIAILVKAVQEQQVMIEELKAKVAALESI